MGADSSSPRKRRLLVISHPCVIAENQSVYAALSGRGWSITIVVPSRWRHAYVAGSVRPQVLQGLEGSVVPKPVVLAGRQQRHFYLALPHHVLGRVRPDFVFIEEEPFAVATLQWTRTIARAGIPFGLQAAETLDRELPFPVRFMRQSALRRARLVAARSPRAAELAREQGARGEVAIVPHSVPDWPSPVRPHNDRFTVGFAGRLVPEKGILDLLDAARLLASPVRLLLVGDGPLAAHARAASTPDVEVEVATGIGHSAMAAAYARMDVLVLPSRTTRTWTEQFGRVLVEALYCGTPVVGSDSGEIPWVIRSTAGGRLYPEGDAAALAAELGTLMTDEAERRRIAERGRTAAVAAFSTSAIAERFDGLLRATLDCSSEKAA